MFDETDRKWLAQSIRAEQLKVDIWFLLSEEYHPDPNDPDGTSAIPLPKVDPPNSQSRQASVDNLLGREMELVDHYRRVLNLAAEHKHAYNEIDSYFWLSLTITSESDGVWFSIYNTLEPMKKLFDWLATAIDGALWHDLDQGWEMLAIREGSHIHFRQGGFDQGGEQANIAFPRDPLIAAFGAQQSAAKAMVERLSSECGEDYWTRHRYDLRGDL